MTIKNTDTRFNVEPVLPPDANLNVTLQMTVDRLDSQRRKRSIEATSEVIEVSLDGGAAEAGLASGSATTITGSANVTLARDMCEAANYICVLVTPATGASYELAGGTSYIYCVDITAQKECLGM